MRPQDPLAALGASWRLGDKSFPRRRYSAARRGCFVAARGPRDLTTGSTVSALVSVGAPNQVEARMCGVRVVTCVLGRNLHFVLTAFWSAARVRRVPGVKKPREHR
jgi:hypothetical protein